MAVVYGIRSDNKCKCEVIPADNVITVKFTSTVTNGIVDADSVTMPEKLRRKKIGELVIIDISRCVNFKDGSYDNVKSYPLALDLYITNYQIQLYTNKIGSPTINFLFSASLDAQMDLSNISTIDFYVTFLVTNLVETDVRG